MSPWYVGFSERITLPDCQLREWDHPHPFFLEAGPMSTTRTRKRPPARRPAATVAKARGVLHPRVQKVGPEHFGIVCFDCAKARSKFLLADFYGRVLIPPTTVTHNRTELDAAVAQVRQAFAEHQLRDGLVAIERTGRYHRIVQRTFAAAGFETRILHPFATKQFRLPVDPGNKTDDTDLAAIHRATVTGCALLEATRDEAWTNLLLVIRQRRDLVRKGAALNCQIRDHLEAALPGFAACFDKLWESPIPWHLLQHFGSAEQLHNAGVTTLCQSLQQAGIRCQRRTIGWCPHSALMPGTETWWLSPTDTCGRPPQADPLAQVSISDKAARNRWRTAVQSQAESALGEAPQLGRPAR